MRVKKTLLVCWPLILAASALAAPPQIPQSSREISLTIDRPAGWPGVDREGDDLNIRCTFRNRSKKTVRLMLADHNNYTGAKPFPYGLKAKVTGEGGEVITYSIDMGDWYTSHYYAEGNFEDTPADWVSLKPGQEVVRIVPLAVVLRDLWLEDWEGLKAGEYDVQLRLGAVISNRIKLKVVKRRAPPDARHAPDPRHGGFYLPLTCRRAGDAGPGLLQKAFDRLLRDLKAEA